jgi:hypothetical protein
VELSYGVRCEDLSALRDFYFYDYIYLEKLNFYLRFEVGKLLLCEYGPQDTVLTFEIFHYGLKYFLQIHQDLPVFSEQNLYKLAQIEPH